MLENQFIKKNVYKELARELSVLAEFDGTQATCLNILEQLPYELQPKIISDLAETNNPKLIPFFQLVSEEMKGALKKEATKALIKMVSLGYQIKPRQDENGILNNIDRTAFASKTRLHGTCIVVFLTKTVHGYQAHYFTLAFNHLGIKDYFQHCSPTKAELLATIKKQDLVLLEFSEAQRLLLDAYNQNEKYGTKIAKGFSQYQHLLTIKLGNKEVNTQGMLLKLQEAGFSEKTIINTYLYALKNMDGGLVYDLAVPELQKSFGPREQFIRSWTHPFEKCTFIKSRFGKYSEKGSKRIRSVELVLTDEEDELKKVKFEFELFKCADNYFLGDVRVLDISTITGDDSLNPLNFKVYTSVFLVNNYQKVQNFFQNKEQIHLTGEFENGLCYKWFQRSDPLEKGIDISQGVYGEFILTEKELIVFGANLANVTELTYFLLEKLIDNKGVTCQLKVRDLCTIREVYQVINNSSYLLASYLAERQSSFFIPPYDYQVWYSYCQQVGKEKSFSNNKIRVFHIFYQNKVLEVIFHENFGLINLFNSSLQEVRKYLKLPTWEIYNLQNFTKDTNDKWFKLKLIRLLAQDNLTKAYTPYQNSQQLAQDLKLIIK